MTWENDKNETATQIYSFIADFDEKIYANEERREDSLIQSLRKGLHPHGAFLPLFCVSCPWSTVLYLDTMASL